ncbi:dihydrofolate reductase [Candidatus Roizmanbacteria bacterium]|nr:dihydrofolate reductase [Candidatus Roizmanbacteria bacterium]
MAKVRISIIAAIGQNRELGKDNKLLWHIPEDMKRFKKLTQNHAVIMGRKTYESIGKPLPNRKNIIITHDSNFKAENCFIYHSFKEIITEIKKGNINGEEVFVIGGGQIYREALPYTDMLYLTIVDASAEADTFFPDYSTFKKVVHKEKRETDGYKFTFLDLEK